ncbi:hypothetical protein [Nocardia thraciensis]
MAPRMYPEPTGGGAQYLRPRDAIAARKRREFRDTVHADRDRACAADDLETALACEDLLVRWGMDPGDRRTCGRCGWWADHAHHPDQWATVSGQAGHMRIRDIREALVVFDRAATETTWTLCPGDAWTETTYGDTTFTVFLADEPVCAAFIVDRVRAGEREYTPALNVWFDARATAIADAYHDSTPAAGQPASGPHAASPRPPR